MAYGPGESRFVEEKRHFEKPIPISDIVQLDRERCILCDRCTRFAKEVAGDPLIHFIDRGNQTQVNTFPDDPFASYFSGNTVQICPVGALDGHALPVQGPTVGPRAGPSRPAQSCSVGCRIVVQSSRNRGAPLSRRRRRSGELGLAVRQGPVRVPGRQQRRPARRSARPARRRPGRGRPGARRCRAPSTALKAGLDRSGPDGVAIIGGARLTNEAAFAWAKLAKGGLGTDHVDAQLGDGLPADAVLGLPRATIDDACRAGGTVLLLGPDLEGGAAGPVPPATARRPSTTTSASSRSCRPPVRPRPRCGNGDLPTRRRGGGDQRPARRDLRARGRRRRSVRARTRAGALLADDDRPLTVFSGGPTSRSPASWSRRRRAAVRRERPGARFLSALRRANVHGALDMRPGARRAPRAGQPRRRPAVVPRPLADGPRAARARRRGHPRRRPPMARSTRLILLGADPLADLPDRELATRAPGRRRASSSPSTPS